MCHDPHLAAVSGEPDAPREEACLACHSYSEHGDHPVGPEVIDPRTGGAMRCVSCHAPHGSGFAKFLTDDPGGRLCVDCHTDKLRQKRG